MAVTHADRGLKHAEWQHLNLVLGEKFARCQRVLMDSSVLAIAGAIVAYSRAKGANAATFALSPTSDVPAELVAAVVGEVLAACQDAPPIPLRAEVVVYTALAVKNADRGLTPSEWENINRGFGGRIERCQRVLSHPKVRAVADAIVARGRARRIDVNTFAYSPANEAFGEILASAVGGMLIESRPKPAVPSPPAAPSPMVPAPVPAVPAARAPRAPEPAPPAHVPEPPIPAPAAQGRAEMPSRDELPVPTPAGAEPPAVPAPVATARVERACPRCARRMPLAARPWRSTAARSGIGRDPTPPVPPPPAVAAPLPREPVSPVAPVAPAAPAHLVALPVAMPTLITGATSGPASGALPVPETIATPARTAASSSSARSSPSRLTFHEPLPRGRSPP
ncbi:hypothetical protein [Polyangium jinanense]|uniref:Uncharacterized protein n=1 Tax=Polyangium jinanense TaxID=2829994 RepID=A0A9X4AWG5_9BACT|nr:hypothetical protein [Polyangium jinanense]MDC3987319.1 hypothetical protein [Polyangium jinanense]